MSDAERNAIETELLLWMREAPWRPDEARFDRLALRLFRYQARHCPAYTRLLAGRGVDPDAVVSWREVPALPTAAFKESALRCFPEANTVRVFRTSGTTSERRGELHLDTLELYEASLRASFHRGLLSDLAADERLRIRVLAPSGAEAPDSSLSHMFEIALREWGDEGSGFDVEGGAIAFDSLVRGVESAPGPVLLCGTAFAFVHVLDELERRDHKLALPPGSRLMETGGFKGRSREIPRAELYRALEAACSVSTDRIVNQYGMTELGSQFYDTALRPGGGAWKDEAPWARLRVVDPLSGREVSPGSVGQIEIVDLANTGSVLAVRSEDLGRRVAGGFEVLGRAVGAEVRGCSTAADALLA